MKLFFALLVCAILWVIFFCLALSARGATLQCTIPDHGQRRWTDPSYGPDSTMLDCADGDTVSVDSLKLYRWQNGRFELFRSYFVRGREGQTFTSDSLPPGNYYMNAKNGAGESCGGNVVTIPGVTTGVEPGEGGSYDPVVSKRTYDLRGRLVRGQPAAGIYWVKERLKSGKVRTRRVVILK